MTDDWDFDHAEYLKQLIRRDLGLTGDMTASAPPSWRINQ